MGKVEVVYNGFHPKPVKLKGWKEFVGTLQGISYSSK